MALAGQLAGAGGDLGAIHGDAAAGTVEALTMGNAREVVCVTGASSQLGVFLLPRLREAGFRVLALGRNAPLRPLDVADRVTWMRTGFLVDGERGDQVVRQPPPDQLVSCGPLDLALRLVLRHPSLQRVACYRS